MSIKYLLGFLFFCFSFPTVLHAQEGNCVVSTATGHPYHLALDNKFQNEKASQNVKISGIPEGDYWITILFQNIEKKAIKTHIRILGNKETSYDLVEYKGSWKLNQTSSVTKSSIQSLNTNQLVLPFNKAGVEIRGMKDATEIKENMVHSKTEINRVQGDKNDAQDKRMGNHGSDVSGSNPDGSTPTTTSTPTNEPKEGTFVTSKYIEMDAADGTKSIVEERVTTIKTIVERNGQRQMKTKKGTTHTPTDFTCLPMNKEVFITLKETVQKAEADQRFDIATNGIKEQCTTPGQIKAIGDLILSDVDRNNFAIAAKPTCADAKKFPYTITEPVVIKEEPVVQVVTKVEVIKEEEIEVVKVKTKAELKAELKALKAKEKADKKVAKAKEKADKKAAKEKAKAAKKKKK
jgi:hypothetical protein